MRLSPLRLGFALGATWGLGILLVTLIAIAQGQDHLLFDLISIYPGYGVTLTGAVTGFLWGFIDGFFGGYVLAWLYNAFGREGCHTKCCAAGRCDDCGACEGCGMNMCGMCHTTHTPSKKKKVPAKKKPAAKSKKKAAPKKKK